MTTQDERDEAFWNQPPAAPDSYVCPQCGATYPDAGGCYGQPGESHGWVTLTERGDL